MGALNSCCVPYGKCGSSASTSTPKEKGHRRNLSATFNMSIVENTNTECSLVNINTASEEELMTLPGVNRVIAKSIVDYRNHIGGFRRVEDLALTPGVGAAKLAMMHSEIYVDSPVVDESVNGKQSSSPQNKKDSSSAICINSANIFNLLMVKGIGMTIAKNIVAYREKNGKYKKLDELLKVKGIGFYNFEEMCPFLTVEDKHQALSKKDDTKNGSCVNGTARLKATEPEHLDQEYVLRSQSSLENLLQIMGPLAKVPERPKVEKVMLKHNNRQVFRLASWSLDKFSLEKASNPGVKDVICMTILENGFGLVAVQDLVDKDALDEICRELNSPTLPNVRKWIGRRGQWACVVSEAVGSTHKGKKYQGFLYDKSQNIELIKSSLLKKSSAEVKTCDSMPFLAIFKIRQELTFALVSLHVKTAGLVDVNLTGTSDKADSIHDIISATKQEVKGEERIIIVGDFSHNSNGKARFDDLLTEGYVQCIPSEKLINIMGSSSEGGMTCGNIWISKETQDAYTGVCGVVKEGLFSSWIPSEWSWGGVVSNDHPVYAQLYSCENTQAASFY